MDGPWLEATTAMEPELAAALDKVVSGPCFVTGDLPTPTEADRRLPTAISAAGELLEKMEAEDEHNED